MTFPTRQEVLAMFRLLENPPHGSQQFFNDHVASNLTFHAIGPPDAKNIFTHTSKEVFLASGFGKLSKAVQPPGIKLRIADEDAGLVVDEQRGTAAVMLDAADVVTLSGVAYHQHYSWHVKFGEDKMITHVWAYLDHRHLEDVLGTELKRIGEA